VATAYDNVVIIGIDELDKLKNAQQAEAFLNGVKSVFGIARCFYLISVSEHALASFDRRGIGFRDAFDSALDDIVLVDFLTLDQSRTLLNRRILRLPDPYLQLCHMLSGGLPRDLIRQARALLEIADLKNGSLSVVEAADALVARDVDARLRATRVQASIMTELPETSGIMVEIAELPADAPLLDAEDRVARFQAYLDLLSDLGNTAEGRELERLAAETITYYHLMQLIRRVAPIMSTADGWRYATEYKLADLITGVRQALEINVQLAIVRLRAACKAIDEADNSMIHKAQSATNPRAGKLPVPPDPR
jgi:hypothetical protein